MAFTVPQNSVRSGAQAMINALSIDWEDWYQVPLAKIPLSEWKNCASYVEPATYLLLEFLQRKQIQATFFVSGYCAERHPQVLRDIAQAGHEIESHGYWHELAYLQGQQRFEDDIARSVTVIQEIVGRRPAGYRAPAWSITRMVDQAMAVLLKNGFSYDSSILQLQGWGPRANNGSTPYFIDNSKLLEIPPSTIDCGIFKMPVTGGFFLRCIPVTLFRLMMKWKNRSGPAMIYFHPWEVRADYPRMPIGALSRFVQYFRCGQALQILDRLCDEFEFGSFRQVYPELKGLVAAA